MKRTQITSGHLKAFRHIVRRFGNATTLAKFGRWRHMPGEEIWRAIVDQVIVVGSSAPLAKLARSEDARRELGYLRLLSFPKGKRIAHLHRILRAFGVRYAARNPRECRKSIALNHNLLFLRDRGGPRLFVAGLGGLDTDYEKVKRVMQSFAFIKSKGARDLLIELGIVKDAIAFDVRLQGVLKALGVGVPKGFPSGEARYRSVEEVFLEKVCRPLRTTGASLDRILFQHADEIVRMLTRQKEQDRQP